MEWIVEDSLTNFNFWSGAADNAKLLEYNELKELDEALPSYFEGRTPTATEINDLFWFEFETVCSLIGLKYDKSRDVVIRGDEDEGDVEMESVGTGMNAVFERIRKDNPILAEAMEAGYKACMEGAEIVGPYSPDVVVDDEPNYTVILAHDSMDPHPARVAVKAYDEGDAIERAVKNLAKHGIEGYAQTEQPEYPGDYIEVANGWVPSQLVNVEKCSGIRAAHVPEQFLSAIVNADRSGMSSDDEAEFEAFCQELADSGIPGSGLTPVCGPDGEFWDVDDDPFLGRSVLCSVFVGTGMNAVFERIRKDNPILAEAMEAGYKACMEGAEIVGPYSPDVVVDDEPNYTVILAHDSMDPHPARVAVKAYDEGDAIERAVKNLAKHGIEGYAQTEQPEYPGDYIEVANGWVPSQLVNVEKCSGIRAAHVPEQFLSAIVNADRSGMSSDDEAEFEAFCQELADSGIPGSGLTPVCGPDGEFWDVDDDPFLGRSVLCSVFVGR